MEVYFALWSIYRTTAMTQLCIILTIKGSPYTSYYHLSIYHIIYNSASIFRMTVTIQLCIILTTNGSLFTSYSWRSYSTCQDASGWWWREDWWSSLVKGPLPGEWQYQLFIFWNHLLLKYCSNSCHQFGLFIPEFSHTTIYCLMRKTLKFWTIHSFWLLLWYSLYPSDWKEICDL